MNQKDLIKYGLLALGAYLVWKYIEDHGGLSAMFGTLPAVGTTPATHTLTIQPAPNTQPVAPSLDMTGLVVTPDINGSLTGTVKINSVPTTLSIIQADGRIFNTSGQEVTASLQSSGIDIAALRTAFSSAPQSSGVSGLGAMGRGFVPSWLM